MYPLEDDGAQVLPDYDDLSTVSEASTIVSQRTEGGTAYRRANERMIIASRRVNEPIVRRDSMTDYTKRCNICRNHYLRCEDSTMVEIFGDIVASATTCCSRRCYRAWHARKVKDKGRFLEPGQVPFSRPDSARKLRHKSTSSSSQRSSQSPRSQVKSQSSSTERAASPEPARSKSPHQAGPFVADSAAPPKARPGKRQKAGMQLMEVKEEEPTITW